jgi:hypothetical protein
MKKKVYQLTPTGRIRHYNVNYDVDRFSFVPETTSLFEKVVEKVNDALNNFVGQRPYEMNWEEITTEYVKIGQSDVPNFASQYVFAKFLNEKRSSEKENMQLMYLEIVAVINKEIELGHLPSMVK